MALTEQQKAVLRNLGAESRAEAVFLLLQAEVAEAVRLKVLQAFVRLHPALRPTTEGELIPIAELTGAQLALLFLQALRQWVREAYRESVRLGVRDTEQAAMDAAAGELGP